MNYHKPTRIYLIILTIITVAAVFFGGIYHCSRWFHFGFWDSSSDEQVSETVEFTESFDSIIINADIAEITFEEGASASVYYCFPEKLVPTIDCQNGTLTIKEHGKESSFTINSLDDWNDLNGAYEIVITLPKDTSLANVDLDLSMGSAELAGMTIDDLNADLSMGDLEVSDSKIGSADGDLSMGNAEFSNVTLDNGKFDLSMGNCEISGSIKALTADVSMGNLEVSSDIPTDEMELDLDCDMGSCSVNGISIN